MDSFLVRVWHPATEPTDDELRGTVVHLPSRRSITFQDRATLLAILGGSSGTPPDGAAPVHAPDAP